MYAPERHRLTRARKLVGNARQTEAKKASMSRWAITRCIGRQDAISGTMNQGLDFRRHRVRAMIDAERMKRRTFKALRANRAPEHHHKVYVVLLAPAAGCLAAVRAANPNRRRGKPCVYVGMTGLTPDERFANLKQGIKAAAVIHPYGIRLGAVPLGHQTASARTV